MADLREAFGDPLFEGQRIAEGDVREFVSSIPEIARAMAHLHQAYTAARGSAEMLAEEVVDRQERAGIDRSGLASEQVSEFMQRLLRAGRRGLSVSIPPRRVSPGS